MRQLVSLSVLLLGCALASAQTGWVPPGTYSEPFAPRQATPAASPQTLSTPSLTLDTPTLVVGASNGTVSSAIDSGAHFNQPLAYAPGVRLNQNLFSDSSISSGLANFESSNFEFGAAMFQSSYGVAALAGKARARKQARIFTNADVARASAAEGTVKYAGKLERWN